MLDRRLYQVIKKSLGQESFEGYETEFKTRLIVQKVLYLLTHGKNNPQLELPYEWSFYIRGPYSSEIAHMIFHMNNFREELYSRNVELSEIEMKSISFFTEFKNELNSKISKESVFKELKKEEIYELIATLVYISLQIGNNKEKLSQKLQIFKPDLIEKLQRTEFETLCDLLTEYHYL